MAQAEDLTALGIAEAGRRLKSGTLSPVDLTQAYLGRIRRLDPQINAYITVTAESALAEAGTAAAEIAAGRHRGPLHGVPIALKDNIDTFDMPTTSGVALFRDFVPAKDAFLVARLRRAGAIILAKATLGELGGGLDLRAPTTVT